MNLYLRLLLTFLRTRFERSITTRQTCLQSFRVRISDVDAFGHMNNGRYLQIMDVARFRWLLRTGTIRAMRANRWAVALGGNMTRYRRSLRLFAHYEVSTRLVCWDEHWFYLEHSFIDASGEKIAVGISRAAFRKDGARVPTSTVMRAVDRTATKPPMPAYLREWLGIEKDAFRCAEDGKS